MTWRRLPAGLGFRRFWFQIFYSQAPCPPKPPFTSPKLAARILLDFSPAFPRLTPPGQLDPWVAGFDPVSALTPCSFFYQSLYHAYILVALLERHSVVIEGLEHTSASRQRLQTPRVVCPSLGHRSGTRYQDDDSYSNGGLVVRMLSTAGCTAFSALSRRVQRDGDGML